MECYKDKIVVSLKDTLKKRKQNKDFHRGLGLRRFLYFSVRSSLENDLWYYFNDNLFERSEKLIGHQVKLKLWADIKYDNEKA